jgi:hypothetical protein
VHAKIATKAKKNMRKSLKEFMSSSMEIRERKIDLKLPEGIRVRNAMLEERMASIKRHAS